MMQTTSQVIRIEVCNPTMPVVKRIYYIQKGSGAWRESSYLQDVYMYMSRYELEEFKRGYPTEFYQTLKQARRKHGELEHIL